MDFPQPLPIDPLLPEILASLERHPNLVLQASPGSGKTTRVPPSLLKAKFLKAHQEILVLVPRRLAAKLAAYRVAEEMGEEVGGTVGYQFRFERAMGSKTRLKFLTEGMLLRILMGEPELPQAGVLILDEFHERHLHSDIALSYLRWLQQRRRPDLRIVVMSATLEAAPLARFLGEAPVLTLEAPRFPVETVYLPPAQGQRLEALVDQALQRLLKIEGSPAGDVLVFLPGMAEIRRTEERLKGGGRSDRIILPLHGELPREQQAQVFKKFRARKVILATNVAESSVTIDGVGAVIDSGLHRQPSFSWWSGVPALRTRPISQASAIQRSGRAGRQGPGMALRLFAKSEFEARPAFDLPEIRRADLTQTFLELKSLLGGDFGKFPWFDPPANASLEASAELLYYLGALGEKDLGAALTPLGKRMSEFPLHPRLARILVEAERKGVYSEAAWIAAKLSEDALSGLDVLEEARAGGPEGVRRLHAQLLRYRSGEGEGRGRPAEDALALSVLSGYPDRVAKKRVVAGEEKKSTRGVAREYDLVFAQGSSGTVPAEGSVVTHDFFAILDVQERRALGQAKGRVHVRALCPIEVEWLLALKPSLLREAEGLAWEAAGERVLRSTQLFYGQLLLEESLGPAEPSEETERVLLKEGLGITWERLWSNDFHWEEFLQALSKIADPHLLEEALARLQILKKNFSEGDIPEFSLVGMKRLVLNALRGGTSLNELRALDLPRKITETLPPEIRSRMSNLLPSHLELAKGRKAPIHYELDKNPWVASRLQDFFGIRETPRILQGRLALTLHLLAPNQRAVQVTQDLKNFWEKIYPEVRKELRGRYPKHAWPEDPLINPPTLRPKK